MLSPNEGFEETAGDSGDYQLINPTSGVVYNFDPPGGMAGGGFDQAAEDCNTGIALASDEFTNQVFLVDLTKATFSGSGSSQSWTSPYYQFQTVTEFAPFNANAGTCAIAVASNSHIGAIASEYGGNAFGVFTLPSTPGTGTPALSDWVEANIPNTPNGLAWQMGLDPIR